jgi:hypothetical protein
MLEISKLASKIIPPIMPLPMRGRVCGFNVARHMYRQRYAGCDHRPPIVVKLKAGPAIAPDPVDAEPQQIRRRMPVEMMLKDISDQVTLPELRSQSSS